MQPQQAPSYTASPLGSFPELSQMYATSFSAPLSDAKVGVQSAQDKTSIDNANQAAKNAQDQAAAFADKNKYTVQQRGDGGFGFYGPDGKEVSAAQYANNTGQKLTDVLKDSKNPIDIRYNQDQTNLTKYLQAKANSKFDPKQRAIAQQIEQQTHQAYGIHLGQQNPSQLIQAMQANYPTIYGGSNSGFSGASTFLPSASGAQAQAEADNLGGFYTSQGSTLANQKKR